MDHCVSCVYYFIIENNHSPIYNMVADQHNMFIMRPWNEVPQMVEIVQLWASPSLPVVFFSSLLWLIPASPKHLSLLELMTTSIYANRMATQLAWSTGEQVWEGGKTPWGRYEGNWPVGLASVAWNEVISPVVSIL